MLGMDEIINDSDAFLEQTIRHRKVLRETVTVTIKETWTTEKVVRKVVRYFIGKRVKTTRTKKTSVKEISWTTVDETTVEVSRIIRVPPLYANKLLPNVFFNGNHS